MFTVKRIETTQDFAALAPAWGVLLERCPAANPFLSWEWLFSWWQHFNHGHTLRLVTAWQGEELVGIAPLMFSTRRKYGVPFRVLQSLAAGALDMGGFLVRDGDRQIFAALLGDVLAERRWDLFEVSEVSGADPNFATLAAALPPGRFVLHPTARSHVYLPVQGDWDTFFGAISRNLQVDLRKRLRRAERQGEVSFRRFCAGEVTRQHMDWILKISAEARFGELYVPAECDFQYALIERMGPLKWLDASFLFIGEQPVAYNYGFIYRNCCEGWRTGYDSNFLDFSVGKLLMMLWLKDGFERGLAGIDFLRGDESYKRHWGGDARPYWHYRVIRKRPLPWLVYVGVAALHQRWDALAARFSNREDASQTGQ